ncbi:MAG: anthranilate phosphoribosyltransferase [Pseudomonadales bacterium]
MDMKKAVARVIASENFTREEMSEIVRTIMTGDATAAQIGGFLVGLNVKGETVEEIVGAASTMRKLAVPVTTTAGNLVDTCGTGGSGSNKFNVSTASAFVAAAAGASVAKHGNRAATSKSGSADLLEAAGANIMLAPENVARCIETVGVGFLFALSHHSAMKHAIGPRRELGVRTIFNLLGPLTNPARAGRQLIGVFDSAWVRPIAEVLKNLGSQHVMVVHSHDGLDEISISAATSIAELKDGAITEYELEPSDFGFERCDLDSLRVGDSSESLALVKASFDGSHTGAAGIVAMNAGAAIYVSGLSTNLNDGIDLAKETMASGKASGKMSEFVDFTRELSQQELSQQELSQPELSQQEKGN